MPTTVEWFLKTFLNWCFLHRFTLGSRSHHLKLWESVGGSAIHLGPGTGLFQCHKVLSFPDNVSFLPELILWPVCLCVSVWCLQGSSTLWLVWWLSSTCLPTLPWIWPVWLLSGRRHQISGKKMNCCQFVYCIFYIRIWMLYVRLDVTDFVFFVLCVE